jgi:hypothetical protein
MFRNLGKWNNTTGYEMGSSPAKVYTYSQDFFNGKPSSLNEKMT